MTADEKYKKMGSTIVDLGNNYATTEADIMNMATNLASAGTQVGMSESDILALATALSSVGMEAQAGGTAFSKALIEMQLAVETNSDSLKDWADVAGMSTSEFSKRFKEDATGALEAFIQGLSKCGGESDSAIKVLNDMGITETRMRDALLRSANASDVFTSAISTGKNAWEENTALTNEASKRYETTASKLAIMKNNLYDAGITLGNIFLPMIAEGTQKITGLIQKINNLDSGQQRMILGIVGIVAVLSPLLIGIGKLSIGISSIIGLGSKVSGLFAGTAVAAEGAGAAMAGAGGVALGPILLVTAAIAGVVAGMVLLWNKSESFRDFITGIIDTVKSSITGFLDGINIDEKLSGIQSAFSRLGEKLMGLENLFKVIGAVVTAVVVPAIGLLAAGFSTVLGMIEPLITVVGGVIDTLSGLGDIIVGVFTGDMDLAKAGLDLFKQGVVEIFGGLWDMVVGALDGFISGITGFFGTLIQICGIDTFVNGVIEKVSGVFDTIRNVVTVGVMLIAEIFSAAFQIITLPFQFIWVNCKDIIIQTWNEISTFIGGIVNAIVGVISAGFGLVKTYIITPISGAYASAVSIFEGIKSAIFSRVDGIKASAKAGFEAVKSNITGPINTAKSTVLSVFEGIKSGISSKINGARDVVKNAISTIKNAMNFNWKLPNLKLPHISIDGSFSLNPPSVPHFSIAWRAKGAVFDQPTIIPTRLGWQGVGEAGPEAVAPITVLQTYVEEAVERGIARLQRAERDPIDYDKLAAAMSKIETTIRYDDRELGRTIREVLT